MGDNHIYNKYSLTHSKQGLMLESLTGGVVERNSFCGS